MGISMGISMGMGIGMGMVYSPLGMSMGIVHVGTYNDLYRYTGVCR